MKIRVGSRDSKLAVIQSQIVIDAIKKYHPEIEIELVTMKTTGDMILNKTLDKIGGKGLFVKELDLALREKRVDITVHSFKDMPMQTPEDLPIVAVSERLYPEDVLVLPKGIDYIDFSKPIGCSSARRRIQFKKLYPQSIIKPVRGNVLTRLNKLDSGEYGALILAKAGIKRLALDDRISRVFTKEEMIPAGCQGVLAVQARADMDSSFLEEFNDKTSMLITKAERSFVRTLDGGCSSPVAAYGEIKSGKLFLTGLYVNECTGEMKIKTTSGLPQNGEELGRKLAKELKEGIHE